MSDLKINTQAEAASNNRPNIIFDTSNFVIPQDYKNSFLNALDIRDFKSHQHTLFNGQIINLSEQKAAWHTQLRKPKALGPITLVDKAIHQNFEKMRAIIESIHKKKCLGSTGRAITNIVHLGVGGSHLGPSMLCYALDEFTHPGAQHLSINFASSMDGTDLQRLLRRLDPQKTLFIVASKSFSTLDTMLNADTAKAWLLQHLKGANEQQVVAKHFIGISANQDAMKNWGIEQNKQLLIWDWVGGRYSIFSCIGLPVALLIGIDRFKELLAGAHNIDEHFLHTDLKVNIPVQMAMHSTWAIENGFTANAILPYDGRLKLLPNFLQQLIMESNGKSLSQNNKPLDKKTAAIIFGGTGSNSQHSFFQLLHQGTQKVFCDFILFKERQEQDNSPEETIILHHQNNIQNALAQILLLQHGDHLDIKNDKIPKAQSYKGETPSSLLIFEKLTPYSLGQMIALYEHKTFMESFVWDINPFDQWGVELGKLLAKEIKELKTSKSSSGASKHAEKLLSYFNLNS